MRNLWLRDTCAHFKIYQLTFTVLKCMEMSLCCRCLSVKSVLSVCAAPDACRTTSLPLISFKALSHTIIQFSLLDNDHVILIWQVDYAASLAVGGCYRRSHSRLPRWLLFIWKTVCQAPAPMTGDWWVIKTKQNPANNLHFGKKNPLDGESDTIRIDNYCL